MTTPSSDPLIPLGVGVTGVPPVVVQPPSSTTTETDITDAVNTDTPSAVDEVPIGTDGPAGHDETRMITLPPVAQPEDAVDKVTGPPPPFGDGSDKTLGPSPSFSAIPAPGPALEDDGGDQYVRVGDQSSPAVQKLQNRQASGTDRDGMPDTHRKRVTICEKTWVILGKYICCRCTTET